jgi:hypothetical protein
VTTHPITGASPQDALRAAIWQGIDSGSSASKADEATASRIDGIADPTFSNFQRARANALDQILATCIGLQPLC